MCKRVLLRSQQLAADAARQAHLASHRGRAPPSARSRISVSADGTPRQLGNELGDPPDGRAGRQDHVGEGRTDEADDDEAAQDSKRGIGAEDEDGQRAASASAGVKGTGRRRVKKRKQKARRSRMTTKKDVTSSDD